MITAIPRLKQLRPMTVESMLPCSTEAEPVYNTWVAELWMIADVALLFAVEEAAGVVFLCGGIVVTKT